MEGKKVWVRNGKVFLDGELAQADILIQDGKVAGILSPGSGVCLAEDEVLDAGGKWVLPGTVDPHVHIRAPGYEERDRKSVV